MSRRHRYMAALLGAAAALGLSAPETRAAELAYLQLTGGVQGNIQGEATQQQQQGRIEAQEVHHLIRRDPGNGRVVHEPYIFTKRVDRSSVNLYRALDTNETLTAVFRYYRPDPSGNGTTQLYQVVTLTDAIIVAIEPIKGDVFDEVQALVPDRERVRMIYGRIRIDFPPDGNESYELVAQ